MKITGYFREYYVANKYIDRESCEKDRDVFGYAGKKKHIAEQDIVFKRKKIKKGQTYWTMLFPYNGEKHNFKPKQ